MNKYSDSINKFYERFHSEQAENRMEHIAEFADHVDHISDFELADELNLDNEGYDHISQIRNFIRKGADQYLLSLLDQTANIIGKGA